MKKLLVYSHDTFGMGNIRRMLALSEHLVEASPDMSVLLITGSPVIHSLRLPKRLDYIKLPCLTRTASDVYSAKTLGTGIDETLRLRADLIFAAATNFKPDVVLIDKKPCGVKRELTRTLQYLRARSKTRIALILRDILDSPERTIHTWNEQGCSDQVAAFYDKVLVLGMPQIFDPRIEYRWPPAVSAKTAFCGYLGKQRFDESRIEIRKQLGMQPEERLVLVTTGGGEDGHPLMNAYCAALPRIHRAGRVRSLIITGPEMPEAQRELVSNTTAGDSRVECRRFVDNMMAYMGAADLVVSMGGYNTVCEILSTGKPAVVVPRVDPVQEQWIRAQRMARLGLFSIQDPRQMTPGSLADAVLMSLRSKTANRNIADRVNLDALANVARWTQRLLSGSHGGLGSECVPLSDLMPVGA